MKVQVRLILIGVVILLCVALALVNKITGPTPTDTCGDPNCTTHK